MKSQASAIALPLAVLAAVVLASCGEDSPTAPLSASGVELTAPKQTLAALGEMLQLQAVAKDAHGNTMSGVSFTWESSDTNVLSVSDAGLATAVANGSARVTAATDGVSSELVLTVQQSATSVELTAPELTLAAVGEMLQLQAEAEDAHGNAISEVSFTWESSDTNVLSVSDAGLATAVASGSAQVTATTDGVSSGLVLTVQQSAPQLAAAATVTWDGGGLDFNWNNPANWDTDALPGSTDAVIIDVVGDITVTHSSGTTSIYSLSSEEALVLSGGSFAITGASTANSTLTLSGGTLTGAGDLTVDGLLTWSGGEMSGTGKTIANGGMAITGNVFLAKRTLVNSDIATWDPITFHVGDGAVIDNTGTIDIIADAGGQFHVTTVSTLNNTGTLLKSGGTGTATLALSVNNTGAGTVEVTSGTLRFINGGTTDSALDVLAGAGLEFGGGTFTLEAGVDMIVPALAPVSLTAGTLTGAGDLTVNGLLTWSGGEMSGTGKTIANGGMAITGNVFLAKRTLVNSDIATWDPITFHVGDGAVIDNTGTIDIIADAGGQFHVTTVSTLNNTGTLLKSGGTGTATLALSVNNTGAGTVEVTSGTLRFINGGTTDSALDVLAGAGLEFGGGTFTLEAGVDMIVPALAPVSLTAGTLTGAGDLTVDGLLTWSGGEMSGTGKTIANGGMAITGNVFLAKRTLVNSDIATWDPITFHVGDGAVIDNTGTIDIIADAGGQFHVTTVSTLNNTGTLLKSGGTGTATLALSVNNTGTVEVTSGTLSSIRGYTQVAGSTILNSGNLEATNPLNILDIQGGSLSGFGTITGNVSNAGQVNPGLSTGILNIAGNYTQTPTGELNVEIGGLLPGADFDQLNITGNAELAGTLNISLIGAFIPSPDDAFEIMTFSFRTGVFAATNGLDLGLGLVFDPILGANDLILVVIDGVTPLGDDVVVEPVDPTTGETPVSLTFEEVVAEGSTTVTTSGAGPPPPSGFKVGAPPTYYEIETDATFVGSVEFCVDYGGASFGNESKLRLQHREGNVWVDITTSLDTNNDIICGETTTFSVFAIFELVDPLALLISVPDDLNTIIQDNPNTPLADKTDDSLAKLLTAIEELEKTPPDNQAAVGNIEGAVGDLEAAVQDGLLVSAIGNDLMNQLVVVAHNLAANAIAEAVARAGDLTEIADAQQALDDGDALHAAEEFKDAVNKYKDALVKAEGA